MHLIGNQQALRLDPERGGHSGAVVAHGAGIVARSDAAVERVIDALRDAPAPGEESMREAGMAQAVGLQELGRRDVHVAAPASP